MDLCASLCVLGIEILVVSRNSVIATVLQVGPDDVFLREAEHAQSPSSHAGVNDPLGVRHQLWTLKESSPDVSDLWSVLEEPAVRDLVLPANVPRVLPQQAHLVGGVSCVPQGVPQILTRTRL